MTSRAGFTLVELLVVLAIVAVLATIALPLLLGSTVAANEKAALATLRLIGQAQLQFATAGLADDNGNGTGEYGTFGELSAAVPVRASKGGTAFMKPTLVSPAFRAVSPVGEIVRSGYCFRIYLPGPGGEGLLELPGGGAAPTVDADRAESVWCAYAWPVRAGATGRRAFFTNQSGVFTATEAPAYTGTGAPLAPGAALAPGGAANAILGEPAHDVEGRDGNVWRVLGK